MKLWRGLMVAGMLAFIFVIVSPSTPLAAQEQGEALWQEFRVPADRLVEGEARDVQILGQSLSLSPEADRGSYLSPVLEAPQRFTELGPHWYSDLDGEVHLSLLVRSGPDGETWGEWMEVATPDELEIARSGHTFAPLLFAPQSGVLHRYLQFKVTLTREAPESRAEIRDLTFFVIDGSQGPSTEEALATQLALEASQPDVSESSALGVAKPSVISRTAWGCPDGQSSPRRTPRYAAVHHIIIHHTVTPNNDSDWARRVRGIWSYHTHSRGWGDIGYNYLVDPNGNIYEGRAGGDNVIGVHSAYYNTGTMGVSFIGCFHSSCASSWGDKNPRPAALSAAAALMAWKADQRNLNPEGSASGYPIIAGHRDVAQTACPGSELYSKLPQLRRDVKARLNPERDNITLSYGQSDNNTISPSNDQDTYYFNGSSGHRIRITMDKTSGNLDPYVRLYNPDGSLLGIDDDSGSYRNSKLERTLGQNGRYRIVVHSWNNCCTGNYHLSLTQLSSGDTDDNRWLSFGRSLQGTISPNNDRDTYYFNGTRGRVVNIHMDKIDSGLDPLVELWRPDGTFLKLNDDGGGNRNSWLVADLPEDGTYRITARSWSLSSSGRYNLSLSASQPTNLARGKRAVVSSTEVWWLRGHKAVDGSMSTRWSSQFRDPGWIYIDLGRDMTFDQVRLRWETAYGRQYGIYVQPNAWTGTNRWNNVYYTTRGDGGTDTINFSPVTARFVLMYGVRRGTPWGYSLWEFEVYNGALTPIPIVEPDPGDKEPEALPLVEPPLPTDLGKEVALVGEGEESQENMPLISGEAVSCTVDSSIAYTVPVASLVGEIPESVTRGMTLTLAGAGSDPDGGGLTAYRWYTDFAGNVEDDDDEDSLPLVGTAATLEFDTTPLTPGLHTFYLQVQDEEGEWSELVAAQVQVEARVYLPLIIR